VKGIHDVGGSDGYGPIVVDADEKIWHAEWEKAVFSFFTQGAVAGFFNLDEFRAEIESMSPADYLLTPYYAHWFHSFEHHIARSDDTFMAEMDRRTQEYLADRDKPLPPNTNHELADLIGELAYAGAPTHRDVDTEPVFSVGDRVLVSSTVPFHHTRKAGYVQGKVGEIVLHHGGHVFPDSNADGRGEEPHHVYSVRFRASDLFGDGIGDAHTWNTIDLWEPYLSHATSEGLK